MKFVSPYHTTIPQQDILTFLFSANAAKQNDPIWFDAMDPSTNVTFGQAKLLTGRIGYGLRKLGVGANGPGKDIVLSFVQNQVMVAPQVLGVLCAGGIHSACPITATAPELARQINLTKPQILVCSTQTRATVQEAVRQLTIKGPVRLLLMDSNTLDILDTSSGQSIIGSATLQWESISDLEVLETTTACILFSSGTTGIPKGVKLTHRNIVANLCQGRYFFDRVIAQARKDGQPLRMVGVVQNAVPAGIIVHTMLAMQTGMQVYLMAKYDFSILRELVRRYRASALFLVPVIYSRILQEWTPEDLKHVRYAISGAAFLSADLSRRLSAMLPKGVTVGPNWGMTETTTFGTQLEPGELDSGGSVGRLLPHLELKVAGHNGEGLGPEEVGEICIKGPNVMREYFENPKATKAAFDADGWFRTGDIGMMSRNGKIYLKGRSKELLKYKGNQISPPELEAVIAECPGVRDVGVVGVADGKGNDLPLAFIVRMGNTCSADDVNRFLIDRVSPHKKLRGGIAFIDEIPRNLNGKIMRDVLKGLAEKDIRKREGSKI